MLGTIFIACFLFSVVHREQYNLKLANSNQLVSEQVYCELHVAGSLHASVTTLNMFSLTLLFRSREKHFSYLCRVVHSVNRNLLCCKLLWGRSLFSKNTCMTTNCTALIHCTFLPNVEQLGPSPTKYCYLGR